MSKLSFGGLTAQVVGNKNVVTPTVPEIVSVFMHHSIRRAKNVLEEELNKASFAPD